MSSRKLTEEEKIRFRERRRKTCMERYGNPNYNNSKKCKQTKLERYGDENYINLEKTQQTCLEKYGYTHQNKSPKIAKKISEKKKTKETQLKYEETMLRLYGVKSPNNCSESREKYKATLLKNYGVDSPLKCKSIYQKHINTMKERNTYVTSKYEESYYKYLLTKYDSDDIIRQYSDERYPFNCDFYIKSEDLFIELNIHPSHFIHQFNPENEEDIVLLEELKNQNTAWSNMIINVWSIRDYNKFQIAKKNNLNLLVIYPDDFPSN